VAEAANGQEGLERLQGLPLPDLIVLDLMMPVMDGWEFRRRQRQSPQLAPVPVVVLSGAGDTARHASELGATAYLDKPVNVSALLEAIALYCR
jgi:CheY-like chemotaxis protein